MSTVSVFIWRVRDPVHYDAALHRKTLETVLVTVIFTNSDAYIQKICWCAKGMHHRRSKSSHPTRTMRYKETIYCLQVMGLFLMYSCFPIIYQTAVTTWYKKGRLKLCLGRLIVNSSITSVWRDTLCLCPR